MESQLFTYLGLQYCFLVFFFLLGYLFIFFLPKEEDICIETMEKAAISKHNWELYVCASF